MPPGPLPSRVAERGDVDALGPAVHGVRPRVAGPVGDLLGLDHLDDLRASSDRAWCRGCGCATSAGPARPDSAARHAGAARSGTGTRSRRSSRSDAARRRRWASSIVPTILRVGLGLGIDVDHRDRVGLLALRIEGGDVGELLRRRLHGHAGRRVEGGIGFPGHHTSSLFVHQQGHEPAPAEPIEMQSTRIAPSRRWACGGPRMDGATQLPDVVCRPALPDRRRGLTCGCC